jgi:DNA-directed RNA polymerase I, II, and III subunit RPABC1
MQEGSVKRGIIAYQAKITPMARTGIQEMKPAYILEQFTELELMVNITEHQCVLSLFVGTLTFLSPLDTAGVP